MKGNRISFTEQILTGVLLAAMLPPTTAEAQWTVFDPQNFGAQLKAQAQALSRWIETVNQYTRMYENAVGQLTHLQGILRTADELLSQDKRLRSLMSNWGQVIRLSFRIKNQLTNLITGNIRALANMERRLRSSIFYPAAAHTD